jgi:hypothetical protein
MREGSARRARLDPPFAINTPKGSETSSSLAQRIQA